MSSETLGTDNSEGYLLLLEEAPMHPMELSSDGSELWVANIPDATVSVFSLADPMAPSLVQEIGVGLGPVTIRHRRFSVNLQPVGPVPNQPTVPISPLQARPSAAVAVEVQPVVRHEMWVVCQSSNAIFILGEDNRRVKTTIRVPHEPSDLVFDADHEFAYVSLSATNQIVKIKASSRAIVDTYEFGSPFPDATSALVHAEEPTSLLLSGDDLYGLSFLSGNGTTLRNIIVPPTSVVLDADVTNLWDFYDPAATPPVPPPPDRDVFRFDVTAAGAAGSVAGWRFGTLNFDLEEGPNGELWVSNVELNNTPDGEFQFPANAIANHRITFAIPTTGAAPTAAPGSMDLNVDKSTALPADYACDTPNEMVFARGKSLLYVACYGSRNVAVVDVAQKRVIAELRSNALSDEGFGARGLVHKSLDSGANALYVYNRGDNTLQTFQVPVAAGTVAAPQGTVNIGFDITPEAIRAGRFHHLNGANGGQGAAGTQSCNTCHMDGHLDGVAWDLSDFTATDSAAPFPLVAKGTKVTMSLRGIEGTPPFHWRGDRADLDAFDPAFEGLLGGTRLSLLPSRSGNTASALEEFESFIFSLIYPANPNQAEDRGYSSCAAEGFECFTGPDAHDIRFFEGDPGQGVSCAFCHQMRAFNGTNNQVNNDVVGLLADDATQLKGLFDKTSDVVDYGGQWVGTSLGPWQNLLDRLPATGWGTANTGFRDSVQHFVNLGVFGGLSQEQRDRIVDFLDEFDTGIAPAAAYAWTLNKGTSSVTAPPATTLLMPQAEAGHIDLIARGWIEIGTTKTPVGMLYREDPSAPVTTWKFFTSITGQGPFTFADLQAKAAARDAVLTFVGTPVGMGYRLGLDREMDYWLDGDETTAAALRSADADGDGFPDGYEVRLGSDPLDDQSTPASETAPPGISGETVVWTNSSVVKVRWTTDEESVSRVHVYAPGASGTSQCAPSPLWTQEEGQMKKAHVLLLRGMIPGESYELCIESEDPAGNTGAKRLSLTQDLFDFQSVHLTQTQLVAQLPIPIAGPVTYEVSFTVVDELGNPVVGALVDFVEGEWIPGGAGPIGSAGQAGPSDAFGVAKATFTTQVISGSGAMVEAWATDVDDVGGTRLYFHPLDGQFGHRVSVPMP